MVLLQGVGLRVNVTQIEPAYLFGSGVWLGHVLLMMMAEIQEDTSSLTSWILSSCLHPVCFHPIDQRKSHDQTQTQRVGRNYQVTWQREWGQGGEDNSEQAVKNSHERLLLNLPASLPVLVMSQYQRKLCFPWATLLSLLGGWISYFILCYGQQEAYGQTAAHLYLMTIITISSAYLIPAHIWRHHIFSFWDTLIYLFYLVVLHRFLLAATILFFGNKVGMNEYSQVPDERYR